MSDLQQRLEEIRPKCPHGRRIRSLLQETSGCAGTIRPCECCQNATCKASSHFSPWLCLDCAPAASTNGVPSPP